MHFSPVSLTSQITQCSVSVADNHRFMSFPPTDAAAVPFRTCTAHDFSPSDYSVDDILQIILKTRKSWKTLKGQSEAVWPPYLEATMLKALQEYEPDYSRETRMLGRHPMRNRFISDYIHSTTGKYRSAKQVGSRLQQLRDTPEGRELIDILTRCYHTRMDTGTCDAWISVCESASWDGSYSSPSVDSISFDSSSASSSSDSPPTPTISIMPRLPQLKPRQPVESRMPVYIDILPPQSLWSSIGYHSSSTPAVSTSSSGSRPSDGARHIRNIDPTVTFVSPCPVNGKSSYIVLLDGAPVHTEDTLLEYVGPYFSSSTAQGPGDVPTLYNTALVPKYWNVLCEAADPTLYTIVQDVHRLPDPVPNQAYSQRPRPVRIFSAIYHFQYPPVSTDASGGGPSRTSAFSHRTLHGSMPMGVTPTTPLPMSSMYAAPASEGLRPPTAVDPNPFDGPFMLDVTFDQFAFDDFVINMDASSESGYSSGFFM